LFFTEFISDKLEDEVTFDQREFDDDPQLRQMDDSSLTLLVAGCSNHIRCLLAAYNIYLFPALSGLYFDRCAICPEFQPNVRLYG
jgi:hypothetical protein